VALERNFDGPVIITSTQGGSNIEEIALENPDAIVRHPIDIIKGLQREDALAIAEKLEFRDEALEEVSKNFLLYQYKSLFYISRQLIQ
jgi:succinyl-CoA synthetase beta subunit